MLPPWDGVLYVEPGDGALFYVQYDATWTPAPESAARHVMDCKYVPWEYVLKVTGVDVRDLR
jgi:hypothetical protein